MLNTECTSSRVNCIYSYLAKHERVEHECIKNGISIRASNVKNAFSTKYEYSQRSQLIQALAGYISPHDPRYKVLAPAYWRPLHHSIVWRLRRQCQSAQRVHDQVHPEQLHRSKRSLSCKFNRAVAMVSRNSMIIRSFPVFSSNYLICKLK